MLLNISLFFLFFFFFTFVTFDFHIPRIKTFGTHVHQAIQPISGSCFNLNFQLNVISSNNLSNKTRSPPTLVLHTPKNLY